MKEAYSIDTVAYIAASLLTGDDYRTAAKRAFRLLDACTSESVFHALAAERKTKADRLHLKELNHLLANTATEGDMVRYVKYITSQKRPGVAKEKLELFLKSEDGKKHRSTSEASIQCGVLNAIVAMRRDYDLWHKKIVSIAKNRQK